MSSARAILTILKNGETIKSQPIESEALLGRADGCVIRLDDRAVSRQHAVFTPASGGVQVEKKSEFAPLVVNGAECSQALLKDGDVISIGPYLMRLSMQKAAAEEAPEAPAPVEAESPSGAADAPVMEELQPSTEPAQEENSAGVEMELPSGAADQQPDEGVQESPAAVDEDGKTKITQDPSLTVKLVFQPGVANHVQYELKNAETSIGRGKICDIILSDKKSSRKHALILKAGSSFILRDLGSINGTYVNGNKVKDCELSNDDVIRIGDSEFAFKALSGDFEAQAAGFMPVVDEEEPAFGGQALSAEASPMVLDMGGQAADGAMPGSPGAVPGVTDANTASAITGLPGIGSTKKKQSLIDKYIKNFKTLPPKQKVMVVFVVGALFYFLVLDEDPPVQKAGQAKKPGATATTGMKVPLSFASLSAEQKRFVETQHNLGFEHYKNREYDKALYEIRKIFSLIPEYKNAKEIERYAIEGKRKIEAIEEEKKRREEEERIKSRVVQMVSETGDLMKGKKYDQARELFGQVLALDPENSQIALWKKEIEEYEEKRRIEEQQRQVMQEINTRARDFLAEGDALRKKGRCHPAFAAYAKVRELGPSDKKILARADSATRSCRLYVKNRRDPVLDEAKKLEEAGEFAKAFQQFKRATVLDPPHPAGHAGMARIRGVLHGKAKVLYTEAVLAESYSDFKTARKKFKEVMDTTPEDDIYYERAKRKFGQYLKMNEWGGGGE
ncbi:MAG: hypothetical protein A2583_00505 [Bdellovibrionales bacterium RIFOXYD1_FULL_53_11]|nr:MAG: hypothetical protein A2583_00505 [Bdellovibrionales bacterium RIFOXYD1_FULL_53_11]